MFLCRPILRCTYVYVYSCTHIEREQRLREHIMSDDVDVDQDDGDGDGDGGVRSGCIEVAYKVYG